MTQLLKSSIFNGTIFIIFTAFHNRITPSAIANPNRLLLREPPPSAVITTEKPGVRQPSAPFTYLAKRAGNATRACSLLSMQFNCDAHAIQLQNQNSELSAEEEGSSRCSTGAATRIHALGHLQWVRILFLPLVWRKTESWWWRAAALRVHHFLPIATWIPLPCSLKTMSPSASGPASVLVNNHYPSLTSTPHHAPPVHVSTAPNSNTSSLNTC